ncbi:unnamed protein product [Rhizoctonia solani]|uniref:Uncharacterized protein n=1 Tax=Rhizoctonia solani TaxID=456999 RepID=A0A8H3B9Z7_9AGAM|nr:unnamed protein product [Rhizoctonia solani]CAE6521609.1 unnamed protein product [Rhizoctonia solani]
MIYSTPWELIPPPRLDREQADKTKGIWAYRYNGHFFRSYIPGFADIYNAGRYLAGRILRDDEKREGKFYAS